MPVPVIARNQPVELPRHVALALGNGVKPGKLSGIVTHLAVHAGWPTALSTPPVFKDLFEKRCG